MNAPAINTAREMLEQGEVTAVFGLQRTSLGLLPHVFTKAEELGSCDLGTKWPLAKTAWRLLRQLDPGAHLAVLCRTCDSRALKEQEKMNQFPHKRVTCLVTPCDAEQAALCRCAMPAPESPARQTDAAAQALASVSGGSAAWLDHFQRCIKCYGCRNACPVCICPDCRLEDDAFVPAGNVPPAPLTWHLCRATHVADKCVGCGACQEACPSGIPLLALHTALAEHLRAVHGVTPGFATPSPLQRPAPDQPQTGTLPASWTNSVGSGTLEKS